MTQQTQVYAFLCLLAAATACGRAEFLGSTGSQKASDAPKDDPQVPGEDPPRDEPVGPLTGDVTGTSTGTSSSTGTETSISTSNPTPTTEVVFGKEKVYHIGDNQFDASSCLTTVSAYPTVGATYSFEFQVIEDDTQVSIDVRTICGADNLRSNIAAILDGASEIERKIIRKNSSSLSFAARSYNRGKYRLAITSLPGGTSGLPLDRDDFIVGNILIKADKNILPGDVIAQ